MATALPQVPHLQRPADACTKRAYSRKKRPYNGEEPFFYLFFVWLRCAKMTGRRPLGPSPGCFNSPVSSDAAMYPRLHRRHLDYLLLLLFRYLGIRSDREVAVWPSPGCFRVPSCRTAQPRIHGCVVDTWIIYYLFILAVWPSSGHFRVTSCCTMQSRTHGYVVDTYIFYFNFVLLL